LGYKLHIFNEVKDAILSELASFGVIHFYNKKTRLPLNLL